MLHLLLPLLLALPASAEEPVVAGVSLGLTGAPGNARALGQSLEFRVHPPQSYVRLQLTHGRLPGRDTLHWLQDVAAEEGLDRSRGELRWSALQARLEAAWALGEQDLSPGPRVRLGVVAEREAWLGATSRLEALGVTVDTTSALRAGTYTAAGLRLPLGGFDALDLRFVGWWALPLGTGGGALSTGEREAVLEVDGHTLRPVHLVGDHKRFAVEAVLFRSPILLGGGLGVEHYGRSLIDHVDGLPGNPIFPHFALHAGVAL